MEIAVLNSMITPLQNDVDFSSQLQKDKVLILSVVYYSYRLAIDLIIMGFAVSCSCQDETE